MAVQRLGSDNELSAQAWIPVVKVREKRVAREGREPWNDMVKVAVGEMLVQK